MRSSRGFTLVEVIIVIAIIAILAVITTIGMTVYQQDGRDAQRTANVTSIADSLEAYYDANGEYPSCLQVTASAAEVTASDGALAGVNTSTLVAPSAPDTTTNSLECTDLVNTSDGDYFAYIGDGSDSCATVSCLEFTLKYLDETDGTIKTISSKRTVNVSTSGTISATAGAVTYTTANVNWTPVSNVTSYTIQRDTANTFNTGNLTAVTTASNISSYQFTNTAPGTTYYYRIKATTGAGADTLWSNIASRATTALPTPTIANAQVNPRTVTESWGATSGITTYTIQRASGASFSGATSETITGTSKTYSDTPIGTAQYYRVRATILSGTTTYTGAWSNVINYTSFVPQPNSVPTIASSISGSTATGTSGAVSCDQGATPVYSLRETHKANSGSGDNWTSWTAWNAGSRNYSVTAYQGHEHKFQARAACEYAGSYSTARTSSTAASVRGINTPATPTWPSSESKSWKTGTYGHYMWYGTYCPSGTWVDQSWFHSVPWSGASPANNYHEFGFNDYWYLGPSGGANVFYEARYTCASSYTSSGWSPLSSDTLWVYW